MYVHDMILGFVFQGKKRGNLAKEPNVAEFIAALAAGKNAQLMVMACAGNAGSTTLALGAAAHQTGGRAICILKGYKELHASRKALERYSDAIEFVIGDPKTLLLSNDYQDADFVLIDCKMDDHKQLWLAAKKVLHHKDALVVGYNAVHSSPRMPDLKAHFLPIGNGLLVSRLSMEDKYRDGCGKKSRWVVKVDALTGEEHVYRITSPVQMLKV